MVQEKRYIAWQCGEHRPNLRPAGKEPKPGCGKWNVMAVKAYDIYRGIKIQCSPCKGCGKRPRVRHDGDGAYGTCEVFLTRAEAVQFVERKNTEETEDWF